MAVQRPDSGYSWVIVICCAYLHFALFGLFRSGGVMYVAILHDYAVSRELASWPFALCAAVFQLVGPAVSIITHYISQRKAFLLGSGVATIGLAACYFADSVVWIIVFYGVIHGLGLGLVVTLVPVTLNQYFVKHRATAIGMAFSGGTLSSLVFPTVMEWMLEQYSLKESFLILSGVAMNTIVASCFLKPPPWIKNAKETKMKLLEEGSDAKDSGVSTSDDNNHETKEAPIIYKNSANQNSKSNQSPLEKDNSTTQHISLYEATNSVVKSREYLSLCLTADSLSDNTNLDTPGINNDNVTSENSDIKIEPHKIYSNHDNDYENDLEVKKPLMNSNQIIITPKRNTKKLKVSGTPRSRAFLSITSILKQPVFHLITFTLCIYLLGVTSFLMVIVDFAKDKGIPESKGIYIIAMFSVTDFFGRVCLGWITDRNYITRKTMIALNLTIIGILYQIYPLIHSLPALLIASAVNGLAIGSSITLFFVLQADCLGMKKLTLVIGLSSFMCGAISLLQPGMVGLFRDVIGSYNWMFHFLGIIFISFSIIWVLNIWKTRERNSSNDVIDKKENDIKDGS